MIQVRGERVLSGNRMKRKRLSDQKQAMKDVMSKTRKKVIRRITRKDISKKANI